MQIVDSHCHLGECRIFGFDISEEGLISALDSNRIQQAVVQPFPGCQDVTKTHDRIASMAKSFPGRIFGLSSVNPHSPREFFVAETTRAVRDLGFVGVKLHTIGHAVNPGSEDGRRVFEIARELGVTVCVHTGTGIPFSLPSNVLPLARQYKDVPIVLAHAGTTLLIGEAILVAQECPNVYLETSWCSPDRVLSAVRALGADRVMFGSDSLVNMKTELEKHLSLGLDGEELEAILSLTARSVYGLPAQAEIGVD